MTKIKTPEFLPLGRDTREIQASQKNGFLRKEPSAVSMITRNRGNRKEEVLSFQPVPQSRTSANFADNLSNSQPVEKCVSGGERLPGNADQEGASLPCLYSNNTIQNPAGSTTECLVNLLSSYHRKSAHALAENVASLIAAVGLDCLGFLTLTFPDNVSDHKEAYARFDSLNANYLAPHPYFGAWLCVKERQKRGAWHYHMLIDCGADIRTGIDWEQLQQGKYRSAGDHLRGLWGDLRANLSKYGFGRSELLPIRKNAEAMSLYVGKYISKHVGVRKPEDKGVRMCSYSRKWPRSTANFQWATPNSRTWRAKVKELAEFLDCPTLDDLTARLGNRWAYRYAEEIAAGVVPLAVREEILAEIEASHRFALKIRSTEILSPQPQVQPLHAAGPVAAETADG